MRVRRRLPERTGGWAPPGPITTLLPLVLLLPTACQRPERGASAPAYVGRDVCAECHAAAAERFADTHHALAMQAADPALTAGLDSGRVDHFGVPSTVLHRGDRLVVRTQGGDGEPGDFEVTHVLGVFPLRQFLVAFPDGRYQVLPIAWDERPPAEGGQRWFHVYPGDSIPPGDELHWTGPQQTWNYMCAECHVTRLRRNYDPAADRYRTAWDELGVGCEGCHGPGSAHVAWARERAGGSPVADDTSGAAGSGLPVHLGTGDAVWAFDSGATIARRTELLEWNAQTETCGRCHARRETLVDDYVPGRPLLATHRPVLLEEGLYHADGQLLDEVYECGSFLQSRMHRAGVTCSDCHHPTTQEVPAGNAACARCHRPGAFDTPDHHFHPEGSTGARCVACHMPPRTYMVVDPRHDHSLRVPRPDLSLRIGTPNACTGCHEDRTDEWAAEAARGWYGPPEPARHYGDVLDAGRRGLPSADSGLIRLAADTAEAAIVRATAVSLLAGYPNPGAARAIVAAARAPEPLVRLAAAGAGEILEPEERLLALSPLLSDSLLAIRVEAARVLAVVPDAGMTPTQRAAASAAFEEYLAAQRVNAERPEVHVRLGVFHAQRGRPAEAEREYREAIRLGPRYPGGYVNLADLYRVQGRDAEGERLLREGLAVVRRPGFLRHSLGLLLVRARRLEEAIPELAAAVELEPNVPRFAHVYGVALDAVGRRDEALRVLRDALERAPRDPGIRQSLASIEAGR